MSGETIDILIRAKAEVDSAINAANKKLQEAQSETQKANAALGKLADDLKGKLDGAVGTANGSLGGLSSTLASLGPIGLAAGASIGAVVSALGFAFKVATDATLAAAKYGDDMAALADRTGLSTKALQAFEVQAQLGNSSIEAVAGAVNKMQINLMKGSDGFKKLGLDVGRLVQMKPEDAFVQVAKAIEGLGTDAEKAAARVAVFGKSGNDLAGTLKAAAQGAGELGGALSDEALSASAELQDQADLLSKAWERVQLQFGAAIAQSPELRGAIKDLTDLVVKLASEIGNATPKIVSFVNATVAGLKSGGGFINDILGGKGVMAATANAAGSFMGAAYVDGMREATRKMANEVGFGDPTFGRAQVDAARKAAEAAAAAANAAAAKERDRAQKKAEAEHKASLGRQERDHKAYVDAVIKESWRLENELDKINQAMVTARSLAILKEFEDQKAADESNLARARESADQMAQAVEDAFERDIDRILETQDAIDELSRLMQDFGLSADHALIKTLEGWTAGTRAAVEFEKATTLAGKAIAAMGAASAAFHSGSALGGAATGAAFGMQFGPIGAGIGALAGGLLGLFGKAKQAREEMKKLSDQFVSSQGGMEALKRKAAEAGIALDGMFRAKTAEQLKKAIGDIQTQLDLWATGQDKVKAAMDELGLTIDQMGPRFREQELDKETMRLAEMFGVLVAAGGDVAAIADKIGPKVLDLVHQYQAAGIAIPEALRPVLEAMLKNGELVDENGQAYASLEDAGIKFATSMSDALDRFSKDLRQLMEVLARGFHIPISFDSNMGGGGGHPAPGGGHGGGKNDDGGVPEFARGGPTRNYQGPAIVHRNEYMLDEPRLVRVERALERAERMASQPQALPMTAGGGDVYLNQRNVGRVMFGGPQFRRHLRAAMR